jgi:non-heme chloroperoxidase
MISYIEAGDGTKLFYKDWASGKPVVFIHGWALGADMWEYQMPYLAGKGLRCVAYDKRGCGRSGQPWGGYDFDTFADDLAAVIEQLDLREVTLVGHSMGCGDMTRYLSRHGADRVARAALVAPTTPFILKTADTRRAWRRAYSITLSLSLVGTGRAFSARAPQPSSARADRIPLSHSR